MLVEPVVDETRLALDRALARALADRIAAGAPLTSDADVIALRRLLAETGDARQAAILRAVWGRVAARTGPPLMVCGAAAQMLAADRHGLPFRTVADSDTALAEVVSGGAALIELAAVRPWWGKLLARPDLQVIGALPDNRDGLPRALMVAHEETGPTGADRTFWVTDSGLPDARIVGALTLAGLAASPLVAAGGLKLFMLAGYVQPEDGRLTAAPGALKGVIGAAPIF